MATKLSDNEINEKLKALNELVSDDTPWSKVRHYQKDVYV